MKNLYRAGRWATILAFVVITYLAIQPSNILLVDDFNDKGKHVLAFFVLANSLGFVLGWVCLQLLAWGSRFKLGL